MKIFIMAASLRTESINKQLAQAAAAAVTAHGHEADLAEFSEFDMPLYNFDLQQAGFPAGADALKARIEAADGVIFAVPEYNYSIPGAFKNALDWLSRYRPTPLSKKPVLLMGASPGLVGAYRGLWQTRIPIEAALAPVFPDMFGVSNVNGATFTPEHTFADEQLQRRLTSITASFLDWTAKLT
jgi:NAD(P)H-dependent FMN reductase